MASTVGSTSATHAGQATESYSYDAVGNRTASDLNSGYTYQPFNRLVAANGSTFGHDPNNNMTWKTEGAVVSQYTWDSENRLAQVSRLGSPDVWYKYDALGRRIERDKGVASPIPLATETTRFVYDGPDVVRDLDGNGAPIADYLNGPGIDNKFRQTASGTASYFITDHLSATRALTDTSGNVSSSLTHDSFGNIASGSAPTRYTYTGRESDSDAGLMYYRARWYDPRVGRFISEDPIGFWGGINWYAYVSNSSVNDTDPSGLQFRQDARWQPGELEWADGLRKQLDSWSKPREGCGCQTNGEDVRVIKEIFDRSVYNMTVTGQRHENPYWNNFWSNFGIGYLGCGLQADIVTGDLSKNSHRLSSKWGFEIQSGFTPLYHQWGQAKSDNPNDPIIDYDPWHDSFTVKCRCAQ